VTLYEVLLGTLSAALLGLVGVGIEVLRRKLGNVLHEITPNSGASMRDAVDRIEDERGTQIVRTPGGEQRMTVFYEDGIWELIFRSSKPEAKLLKKRIKAMLLGLAYDNPATLLALADYLGRWTPSERKVRP